jgi:uncharacterized iron-regulated protein
MTLTTRHSTPSPVQGPAWRRALPTLALALLSLAGCAAAPRILLPEPLPRVWIFGEQHDQVDQQRQVADLVRQMAYHRQLEAVVLEMAERGRDTAATPPGADEDDVRSALAWDARAWSWTAYGPIVMAAVRAGVPVYGGNLPGGDLRRTMNDASFDAKLDAPTRERILVALREGHCGHLPAARETGMLRVQVARDASMAGVISTLLAEGREERVVLLHTGLQHAARDRGVPVHLQASGVEAGSIHVSGFGGTAQAAGLQVDSDWPARITERDDPCVGLAAKLNPPARAASAP